MRSHSLLLKVIILLGLVGILALTAHFNHIAEYDEALHLDAARNIYLHGVPIRSLLEGRTYLYHPPLFLYLIAPLTGPLTDGTLLGRWAAAAFGLITVATVFRIGSDLKDEAIGILAGLLVSLSTLFVIYAFNIQGEMMLTALIMLGLLVFLRAWDLRRSRYLWLAGIVFALALWVKFLAVLPVAACGLLLLIRIVRQRRSLRLLLPFIVPVAAAVVLWFVYGLALDRTVFLNTMQSWFAGPVWPWDARTHFTLASWLAVVARDVLGYPVLLLLLVTFPWRVQLYRRGSPLLLIEIYAAFMIIYTLFVSVKEVRHLIPLVPVAAILVSAGLVGFLRTIRWSEWPFWGRAVTIGLAIICLIDASPINLFPPKPPTALRGWLDAPYAARLFDNDPYLTNVRDAGIYLQSAAPADAIVQVAHEGTVAGYYADRHYGLLYVLSYDQIIQALDHSSWLLVDKDLYPNLSADEIQRVKSYIADHFVEVARFNQGQPPAAIVYQRKLEP
jgi:4-amino-4-deoxy-L-arabinose transferase-like glycosyltransferase